MEIQNYNTHPGLRASAIMAFAEHPSVYYKKYCSASYKEISNKYASRGRLVDLLITDKNAYDKIEIPTAICPVGQMLEFCNILLLKDEITDDVKRQAYFNVGIKRDSLEKFLERYTKEGEPYVNEVISGRLLEQQGHVIATEDEIMEAEIIVDAIINSSAYRSLVTNGNLTIPQQELFFTIPEYPNLELKSKPDFISINLHNKTINVVDLKVKEMFLEVFPYDFIKRKYYIQALLQHEGLLHWVTTKEVEDLFLTTYNENIKDFVVTLPQYLVYSAPTKETALFRVSDADLAIAKYGGFFKSGYKLKGVLTLLEEIEWHTQHNLWNREKSFYVADGDILLDVFKNDIPNKDEYLENRI